MTTRYIPVKLQQEVQADAARKCGYCRSPEALIGTPLEFEHLTPRAAGGLTVRDNLWLACHRCNKFKGDRMRAIDSQTNELADFFNPRTQQWHEHFAWSPDGTEIVGLTPCGRATVMALRLNNSYIVETRQFWVQAGWWPPAE